MHTTRFPGRRTLAAIAVFGVVALSTGAIITFSILGAVWATRAEPWLRNHFFLMSCLAAANCTLLVVWTLTGGVDSPLWSWMPPYCLFPRVKWLRWVVVLGTIAGTGAGLVGLYNRYFR